MRKQRDLTQHEVASALGISRSMYAMIEAGRRTGSFYTLKRIADFYDCPLGEILELSRGNDDNETGGEAK